MRPPILILHATGTNRDREVAWACELAGGAPEILHVNQLSAGERRLMDYRMLVLPGGFSYGDDLGAGKLWAVALRYRLADDLAAFVAAGRPVLGICNGFQALVKSGLLPGAEYMPPSPRRGGAGGEVKSGLLPGAEHMPPSPRRGGAGGEVKSGLLPGAKHLADEGASAGTGRQVVTLTRNASARFECRWVYLQPQPESPCIFTRGLDELIYCPVAHGEGKLVAQDDKTLARLEASGLIALRYVGADGQLAGYPWNPNGSQANIAGMCSPGGTILGLMPHPEDHVMPQQHPRFQRGEQGFLGAPLFRNGVRYAADL